MTRRRTRRFKTRPINRTRRATGNYSYYQKMKSWDPEQFFKYTRMTIPVFENLLKKIKPRIRKQYRSDSITAEERLVITLQYLSQGTTMQALAWTFHTGNSTIHYVIHETCKALWDVLAPQYLKTPESAEEWLKISKGFDERWNFPHCLGSIDGKHRLENNTMNIPTEQVLPGTNIMIPYFFVGDEAFPLKTYIMRPSPGQNLISRARQVIENTFGIMVARWRILKASINANIENVDNIVKAAVVLHNYCQTELSSFESNIYCPQNFVDSDGRVL
nr:unnamed protein product [Callosobruchus chinensis]